MQKSLIAASISLAILAGCGGSNDNKNDSAAQKVNQAPTATNMDIAARQGVQFRGNLVGNDAEGSITFTLLEQPKLGTLSITDEATGAFIYTTSAESGSESIKFQVSDGSNTAEATLSINISGSDPLYAYQWHLNNSGQNAFSASNGVAGIDMKVSAAHGLGVTGEGVVVAVIDDGVEIAHEDLANNVKAGESYNLITGTIDPTPFSDSSAHGTAVAGIIAAEGWNGLGGRGVAPDAQLIGFNYLDSAPAGSGIEEPETIVQFTRSHFSAYSNIARVLNQSYGRSPTYPVPPEWREEEAVVYEKAIRETFDGKGSTFVKAAGNGFRYTDSGSYAYLPGDFFNKDVAVKNQGMPFQNSNTEYHNTEPYNLTVSALAADGQLSSYSTVGASIFATAPGGEYGEDAPAMVTTDRSSCAKGSNQTDDTPDNPFHGGMHPLNGDCDYRSNMNGTSSAAPNASGVVALIYSANPELSWRDVRHIIASTSTQVDADITDQTLTLGTGDNAQEFVATPKWMENAAGFKFHNYYGFGLLDAEKAVSLAKNYDTQLGDYIVTNWQASNEADSPLNLAIPDGSAQGASHKQAMSTFEYTDSEGNASQLEDLVVEAVQIRLNVDHLRLTDLAVELISPAGTRSVLLSPHNNLVAQSLYPDEIPGFEDTQMMSNAFYGENAKGDWTLKITDANNGEYSWTRFSFVDGSRTEFNMDNAAGVIKDWSIRFHGHSASK